MIKRIVHLIRDSFREEKNKPVIERDKQELEFLPSALEILETAPSRFSRILMLVICIILVATAAIAWYSVIDINATAEGKTIPVGKVKLIQPLIMARVEDIYAKEGMFVKKGDLLIKLDPTESESDLLQVTASLISSELNAAGIMALLASLDNSDDLDVPDLKAWIQSHPESLSGEPEPEQWLLQQQQLYSDYQYFRSSDEALTKSFEQKTAVIKAIEAETSRLNVLLPLHNEYEANVKQLMKKGHVSKTEWLNSKEKQIQTAQNLKVEESRLIEAKAAAATVMSERTRFRQEFIHTRRTSLNEFRDKALEFKMTITKAIERDENCYIRAPEDGVIQQLEVNTVGGVVQPAEKLMVLVPKNTEIQVEAMILNKDIGFVREGMRVEIKVEAFPYTFYGHIDGTIEHISKDALELPDQGLVYSSLIKLDQQSVNVNGIQEHLQVGMSVTADLITGKRRLLYFFLEPLLRYKDEALSVR